jgi:homoserine dehydrogenase
MIGTHLKELVELQQANNVSLLYEGAVCGSIPIIRNLEEYYDNELLHSISGIFNGSSNYILSKIFNENLEYSVALKQAQDLGFAESNPVLDVGGFDAKYKLVIAASHAYGLFIDPEEVLNIGIETLIDKDVRFAKEKNLKIKLVPTARKINDKQVILYVLPKLVGKENIMALWFRQPLPTNSSSMAKVQEATQQVLLYCQILQHCAMTTDMNIRNI